MSAETNKAIVRHFLARIRDGKWEDSIIAKFFAPTYRRYLTPTTPPLTAQEQQERATRLRVAFPDADATLEDIFAAGDRVAYRLTIRGMHRGAFLGIPASQKTITVSFLAILRLENGKFAEEWGGLDQTDLRHQLGAIVPQPATRSK